MRFDMNHISTIYESAAKEEKMQHGDETGANLDNTLGQNDLLKLYDEICPISGDVFASMKDAASDPKNLKLTMVKEKDMDEAAVYVEAIEFATFCEAADLNPGEAAEEIENCCKEMVPGLNKSELHVVFPSDALNKGDLGGVRRGLDVNNDWPVQLLTGCRRYGISVNSGVEDSDKPLSEGFGRMGGRHFEHIEDREENKRFANSPLGKQANDSDSTKDRKSKTLPAIEMPSDPDESLPEIELPSDPDDEDSLPPIELPSDPDEPAKKK